MTVADSPTALNPLPPTAKPALVSYRIRWRGFAPLILLTTLLLCGGTWWLLGRGLDWILPVAFAGALGGIVVTMAGMTWAAIIALTDDPKRGALFVVLPPYMVYYSLANWRLVWQPMLVFLCGLTWVTVTLWAALALLPEV